MIVRVSIDSGTLCFVNELFVNEPGFKSLTLMESIHACHLVDILWKVSQSVDHKVFTVKPLHAMCQFLALIIKCPDRVCDINCLQYGDSQTPKWQWLGPYTKMSQTSIEISAPSQYACQKMSRSIWKFIVNSNIHTVMIPG